jgi:hypothetical protein
MNRRLLVVGAAVIAISIVAIAPRFMHHAPSGTVPVNPIGTASARGSSADPNLPVASAIPGKTANSASTAAEAAKASANANIGPIGKVQPVRADLNPQVASVAEALLDKQHPERLSALAKPTPWSLDVFKADPLKYINEVQPARAFQSAQPGAGVPVLKPMGSTQLAMTQDAHVILRVITQPNMPATFTSFDLGRFSNELASQTVLADRHGVASVQFMAGSGTVDAVHVLAGSPVASGQVNFLIDVTVPAQAPKSGI